MEFVSLDLEVFGFVGRIDPDGVWFRRRFRLFGDEAFGVLAEGVVESGLSGGVYGVGLTVMDLVRRHQAVKSDRLLYPVCVNAAAISGVAASVPIQE
jgi:hypothetical protein